MSVALSFGMPDSATRLCSLHPDVIPRTSDALPQPTDRPRPLMTLERATQPRPLTRAASRGAGRSPAKIGVCFSRKLRGVRVSVNMYVCSLGASHVISTPSTQAEGRWSQLVDKLTPPGRHKEAPYIQHADSTSYGTRVRCGCMGMVAGPLKYSRALAR